MVETASRDWRPGGAQTSDYTFYFDVSQKLHLGHELPNSNSNINEELVINVNSKINEQTKKHSY
jgi:hypothetical protein